MTRIGIATLLATGVAISAAGCQKKTQSDGDVAGNAGMKGSGVSYEVQAPGGGSADPSKVHDIIIHGVIGNVDSVTNDTTKGRKVIVYGVGTKLDSVSTDTTPHPPPKK